MRTRTALTAAAMLAAGLLAPSVAEDKSKSAPAFNPYELAEHVAQQSPFESRTYERRGLKITVGQPRMIMRGPMFPWGMLFDDGSILVIASSVAEGGPPAYLRSTDRSET